ncbi:haloacid dehalogenase-like hydrolase family member protein [Babesia caballi]|uniref:Haloacid dehalogenase-like hydrolase family member protein n=1 Tax=Babesia caballi TaxID=5871 RepID=A0AAV4M0J5_BABCB|nr:haloacid dehalogenase-like hydrolase family member protein [Babesia caballi]
MFELHVCSGRGLKESMKMFLDAYEGLPFYQGYPGIYHSGAIVLDKRGRLINGTYFSRYALEEIVDGVLFAGHQCCTIFCAFDYWLVLGDDVSYLMTVLAQNDIQMVLHACTRDQLLSSDISQIIIYDYFNVVNMLGVIDNVMFRLRRDLRGGTQLTPMGVSPVGGICKLLMYYGVSPNMCAYVGHACEIMDRALMVDGGGVNRLNKAGIAAVGEARRAVVKTKGAISDEMTPAYNR